MNKYPSLGQSDLEVNKHNYFEMDKSMNRIYLLSLHGWVKTPSFSWLLLASHCILRKWQNIEKAATQFFDFTYI